MLGAVIPARLPGLKVYMPYALWHFIECNWGGCYNSIYFNLLVPHLDSASVLDYVLRSRVVSGQLVLEDGIPKPKMYGELLQRLRGVRSRQIQDYLRRNFARHLACGAGAELV